MKKKNIFLICFALMAMMIFSGCSLINITVDEARKAQAEDASVSDLNADDTVVRIGALKGPTSIGLLTLEDDMANGNAKGNYEFTMATAADEITTLLVKGELDIALVPANVSSILYNKTEGAVSVIDINTLGVLYMVSGNTQINSVADLEGQTILLTGKGTTPDYVLQYLLTKNNILDKVTLEYKSEATEVAAYLAEDETAIGLLPQPFVTVACAQNDKLSVIMDMNKLWDECSDNSRLVTGVTVVRNDFLAEHEDVVKQFLSEHESSADACSSDIDRVAQLAVSYEIVPKEPIAKKAIPNCNITCITGNDMRLALAGYLEVLYELNPESIGGKMPGDDFYYGE